MLKNSFETRFEEAQSISLYLLIGKKYKTNKIFDLFCRLLTQN